MNDRELDSSYISNMYEKVSALKKAWQRNEMIKTFIKIAHEEFERVFEIMNI